VRLVSWIVLIAWISTFLRTLLNLRLIPRLAADAPDEGPRVSVIIPARNEERRVEQTVRALLAQTYRNFEIVVVNDRSTDRTGEILAAIDDPRLRVISGREPPAGWLGKPAALHLGSLHATGELLLFIDADIIYAPKGISAAVAAYRQSGVSMIALLPHIEMAGFWENVAMPMLATTVFSFLPLWLSNRTRFALLGIGGGTGNLIARADYDAVGGHDTLKDAVIDDVALARLVRRRGRRTIAYRADDFVAVRMYHGGREIVNGFTKNMFVVLDRSYLLTAGFAVLGVVFHVLPYLLAPLGDRAAVATVLTITATRLILFHRLGYPLLYAVFAHPLMVLFWSWISVRSAWVTGVRRQLHWRGRSYDAREARFGADR
jgi:chlorobactene glucosyltransferase